MSRPTVRGVALLASAVATYLAARLFGTWELYFIALAFLAAVLVSWLLVAIGGRKLQAVRALFPARPMAGDELHVALRVTNGSRLPGLQVTLQDPAGDLGADRGPVDFESLGPRGEKALTVRGVTARRGVHHLPTLSASAEDPWGLVRARHRLGEALEVVVYPRLPRLDSCALLADMGVRSRDGKRGPAAVGASEFRGVRPHYPGEPLSRIDWKSTAKTGILMMREMDDPASGDITLLLDGSTSEVVGEPADTNFEVAVKAAGSVADFALRSGRGVNLLLHETGWRQTRLSPDGDGRRRLLEALAKTEPHSPWQLGSSLRIILAGGARLPRMRTVMLVVLSLDQELTHALLALRKEGVRLALIEVDGESFVGTSAPADTPDLLLSLASAGVPCLSLRHGDDLRFALSLGGLESRLAHVR